jgi:hypothetical protein
LGNKKIGMKFIITITGPAMTYRLDLIKRAFPSIIKEFIIIFTNSYSYQLYKDYHNDFEFVIMDSIRNQYSNCLDKEVFMDSPNEEHFFKNLNDFYSPEGGLLYPYDAQRFILPYLAENNILNFALIDSDFFLKDDSDIIRFMFDKIPSKSMYNTWFNLNPNADKRIKFLSEHISSKFPNVDFSIENPDDADGFIRGFNFENTDDIMLFFNIWNESIEKLVSNYEFKQIYGGSLIMDTAWLCPYIMQIFFKAGYTKLRVENILDFDGNKVGVHCTRPEDTFYFGSRGYWSQYNFDYNNVNTIADFIYKNKESLKTYYDRHIPILEITDTHVYNHVI